MLVWKLKLTLLAIALLSIILNLSKILTKNYGDDFPLDTERGYHVLFNNNDLIKRPIGWSQSGFYLVQLVKFRLG